eukprot:TRINITY_DN2958_c0_g1_i2.p1 TRINITY_DN2958_c0_g1~~TRINITY_DN2958_c0_g1_i2.p1  ORF type:complete len:347 (-),score=90.05 TRINITY_DN2958_c0_g1_i2:423-1463(-)
MTNCKRWSRKDRQHYIAKNLRPPTLLQIQQSNQDWQQHSKRTYRSSKPSQFWDVEKFQRREFQVKSMRRGSSREEVIPRKRNARAAAAVSKGVATSIVGRRGSSFAQEVDGSLDPIEVTAELANGSEVRVRFKFTSIDDWDDVNAELRNSKRHKASQSQDEEERTHSPLIIRISVPRFERDGQSLKLAIVDEDVDAIPVLEIVPASESPESAEQEDVQFASDTDEESQPSKRGGKNAVVKEEEFGSEDDFETEQFPKSSRMTARQRSRLEGFEVEHLSLPSKKQGKDGKAAKEEDELPGDPDDEEAVLRKSEVARKRRLVAQKQDEEEKVICLLFLHFNIFLERCD